MKKSIKKVKEKIEIQYPVDTAPKVEQPKKDVPPRVAPPTPIEDGPMDEKKMIELLVKLTNTPYWEAIKFYCNGRAIFVDQSLRSIDPFKEPTKMAQNQGIRIGLFDLENYMLEEINKRKEIEKGVPKQETVKQGY